MPSKAVKLPSRYLIFSVAAFTIAWGQNPDQGIPESSVTQVSEHVYAIVGWPNVGIVVGNRATLVIDTGVGARNGTIAAREAEKLAKTPNLYLTTTHFHPDPAMGVQSFPDRTLLIRPTAHRAPLE